MSRQRASASAQIRRLESRQGILAVALLVGSIIALTFTIQNAAVYSGWSDAAYHTTVTVTNLTWEAGPANTTITITVNFTAHNPSDTRLALYLAGYTVRLYSDNNLYIGSGSLSFPQKEVYSGHDVTFTHHFTIDNSTYSQQVNAILGAATHIWFISGYATFHSVYTDVTLAITSLYGY